MDLEVNKLSETKADGKGQIPQDFTTWTNKVKIIDTENREWWLSDKRGWSVGETDEGGQKV